MTNQTTQALEPELPELLACPFCGEAPILNHIEPHTHSLQIGDWKMPDYPGSWTIECVKCECGMISDTKDNLVAAWNRRSPAAQAEEAELPPLPEPEHDYITRPGFTTSQMRSYALAARADLQRTNEELKKDAGGEPAAWAISTEIENVRKAGGPAKMWLQRADYTDVALYTRPPAPQGLTEEVLNDVEQIEDALSHCEPEDQAAFQRIKIALTLKIARAIESALSAPQTVSKGDA